MQNVTLTQQEKKEVYLETALGNIIDMLREVEDNIDYNDDRELYNIIQTSWTQLMEVWYKYYKLNQI